MSERSVRMVLVGATGLVGGAVLAGAGEGVEVIAIARRRPAVAPGKPVEPIVADPEAWPGAIIQTRAQVLAIALGTTWRAAGRDETAFRAVDRDLVLACANAARSAGIARCIAVSSVGADAGSRTFYLCVKGEVEEALGTLGFARLDILRPGLLIGPRGRERRVGERLAQLASPLTDRLLHGPWRRYRSLPAGTVAEAILALAGERAPGRFVHENDAIVRAADRIAR